MNHNIHLASLREALKNKGVDVYIIPSTDPHLGENIPEHWRIIAWLTGFTGSAATLVITESFAGLWTDSRYFIQAENQLKGTGFVLMKPLLPEKNSYIDWVAGNIVPENKIAFDGRTFPIVQKR
jgi:Xaa-Pro aminopeptidase